MFRPLSVVMVFVFGLSLALVMADDSETTGLVAMRRERPTITGVGITVAQPEGQESPDGWEVNPGLNPNVFFTWTSAQGTATNFPNAVGVQSGHATGVGTQFYSTDANVGVARGVARVDSYDAEYFITDIIIPWTPIVARVVNQSFNAPGTEALYDNYAARFNVLFVTGMGNTPDVPPAPGSGYNGIGVGFISDSAQSSIGPTSDGRAKPDLVGVHFCCSSFSTPQVSGAAALLLQAAIANDGGANTVAIATNASVIKALLLNGAVKTTNWTNGFTRPLDARYGAGVLNMYHSDLQLRGGRWAATDTNSVLLNAAHPPTGASSNITTTRGWDFSTLQSAPGNDRVAHYYFQLPTNGAAYSATATLVWKKGLALTNLDFFLYETTSNRLVSCSTSSVDNVEHIFVSKLPAGRYDLQVLKRGLVIGPESYALAFDFSPVKLSAGLSGSNVVVSWPASPARFTLQTATNLTAPVFWQDIPFANSILSNAMNTVTLPASSAQFFRLFRP